METQIQITVHKTSENELSLSIRDNGRGMDEAEQSVLWSRYYRGTSTKEKPEGSGLGLAIAKQVVVLHGGDIRVRSRIGEGTEFIITLPLVKEGNAN
uniref:sensor histidine kinase n=1 Tax=Agathobacter sp. TaxID=2021311 RepID=UPI00405773F6